MRRQRLWWARDVRRDGAVRSRSRGSQEQQQQHGAVACVLLLGFPAGLSQLFVRAVVTGNFFVGLARQIVCVLRWARAAFCWSSAFGVFFWALACCFLFERWRQEKLRFVELAQLIFYLALFGLRN